MKPDAVMKINKIGRIGQIFTLIGKIIVGMGIFFTLLGTIIMAVMPEDLLTVEVAGNINMIMDLDTMGFEIPEAEKETFIEEISESSSFSGIDISNSKIEGNKVTIAAETNNMRFKMNSFVWVLLSSVLYEIATLVVLFFIGALCKALRNCDTPFCENVIRKMKNLAFSLIPMALFNSYSESMASGIMSDGFSLSFNIDFAVVIAILLIFGLAYIFQYGAKLQQESDETL